VRPVPTSEDTPLVVNSIYAATKRQQEEMILLIGRTYGIPVVSFRFFNVYGPRQSLSNPYTGVAAIFMSRLKNDQQPVIYEDGNQTRDFIWVEDLVRAVSLVLRTDAADYGTFNLGTGKPVAIAAIARFLARLTGKKIAPDVTFRFRKGDVRHCYADIRRIRKTLGFTPEVSLKEGLARLVGWSTHVRADDRFARAAKELADRNLV
jgi:dTDP-L-rhamnose 4-epimerase